MAKQTKKAVNTLTDQEKHQVLESMKRLLPEGYLTTCTTAQRKTVQSNPHDAPLEFWCCWVKNVKQQTFFALYDGEKIRLLSEEEKRNRIVKSVK